MKMKDKKMLETCGFDDNFAYENVKVTPKYHIV
jgi:hypothetical protein